MTDEMKKSIALQILNGLKTIRKLNIRHNDIKPQNILYKFENGKLKIGITDFGLVNDNEGGTPGYTSPENFTKSVLEKSDIWSFVKTLLFLYTEDQVVFRWLTSLWVRELHIFCSLKPLTYEL